MGKRLHKARSGIGLGRLTGSISLGFSFGLFNFGENAVTPDVPLYETPYSFSGEIRKVVFVTSSIQLDAAAAAELELAAE